MSEQRLIRIELDGFPDDAFDVISFAGTEAISTLFSYSITLASKEPIHDFDALLEAKAHLIFGDPENHIRGMLCSVQQGYDAAWKAGSGAKTRVDVVLVPELYKLTLMVHTKFFRDMKVTDIIEKVIQTHGLTVEVNCSGKHPMKESVLQYQESDLDFIQRLCEHEGIAYHFVHDDGEEKLVFSDTNSAFLEILDAAALPLRTPNVLEGKANLGAWGEEKTVQRFQSRQRVVTKKLVLQDYNEETPHTKQMVEGEAPGKAAYGKHYMFGEHYKDTDEGDTLLELRAEEILARKRLFFGASNAYRMYAGGVFTIVEADNLDPDLGKEYLITEIQAEGSQPVEHASKGRGFHYGNTFTCIPKDVVYRPPLRTKWPVMHGLYHAKVIASGEYADVEDAGKYRVQFLFDLDNAGSIPIRLMEPYVGADYGFHAPLHEGVEVLVGFENGDPDRPIIVSAAHNPDFPNTVKSGNHTQSVWRSGGNNEFMMDDTQGSEKFYQHAQKDLVIKVENDKEQLTGNNEKGEVKKNREFKVGVDEKVEIGSNREKKVGSDETIEIGANQTITVGADLSEKVGGNKTVQVDGNVDEKIGGNLTLEVSGSSTMTYTGDQSQSLGANSTVDIASDSTVTIGGKIEETIGTEMTLNVGTDLSVEAGAEASMKSGSDFNIEGGGDVSIEATVKLSGSGLQLEMEGKASAELKSDGKLSLEGGGGVEMKGSKVEMKSDGELSVKGSVIKLN